MKILLILIALLSSGCVGMAEYNGPPPGATGDSTTPTDPEDLRVDPKSYPVFHVTSTTAVPQLKSQYNPEFESRLPLVPILPTDKWYVTHKWGNYLLITSESYDRRQCEYQEKMESYDRCARALFSKKFEPQYFHAIYLNKDGNIFGGWKEVANPKRIVLSSERRTYFNPSAQGNIGWEGVSFEQFQ